MLGARGGGREALSVKRLSPPPPPMLVASIVGLNMRTVNVRTTLELLCVCVGGGGAQGGVDGWVIIVESSV